MLAGPKRSQKYSIDPRGTVWASDDSKIGNKLMEKMGWSKGEGLGANNTGDPHHIIIRKKLDNKGVGCINNHADNWLAHQDDFNCLLDNLKADHTNASDDANAESTTNSDEAGDKTTGSKHSSLDELAKNRKRRLHYHKFTKGKDLSLIKSGDLDKIMGKRAKVKSPEITPVPSIANSGDESTGLTKLHGVETTTSTSNIQEYFSKKMAQLKENRTSSNSLYADNNVIEEQNDTTNELPPADSDSNASDGVIMMHSSTAEKEVEENKKKKKKNKKKKESVQTPEEDEEEEPAKKKKKSKKRKLEDANECEQVEKKKKSKSNKKQDLLEDIQTEVKSKKKKKNKKNKNH